MPRTHLDDNRLELRGDHLSEGEIRVDEPTVRRLNAPRSRAAIVTATSLARSGLITGKKREFDRNDVGSLL